MFKELDSSSLETGMASIQSPRLLVGAPFTKGVGSRLKLVIKNECVPATVLDCPQEKMPTFPPAGPGNS